MAFRVFIDAMLRDEPITIFGDGTQSRTNTFVSDIVRGTIDGATSDVTGTFNLSGDTALSVSDVIRLIGEALGVDPSCDARRSDWATSSRRPATTRVPRRRSATFRKLGQRRESLGRWHGRGPSRSRITFRRRSRSSTP